MRSYFSVFSVLTATALFSLDGLAQQIEPPSLSSLPNAEDALRERAGNGSVQSSGSAYHIGSVGVRPRLSYSYSYGDGYLAGGGSEESTGINTVTAGALFQLNELWSFDYSPSWSDYTSGRLEDRFSQSADLSGSVEVVDWVFDVGQTYRSSFSTLFETGRQTEQENWSTAVQGSLYLSSMLRFQTGVSYRSSDRVTFSKSKTLSGNGGFVYEFSPRLSSSLTARYGHQSVDPGSDLTFGQLTVGVDYFPTEKIAFAANVGTDMREFSIAGSESSSSLIYSGSLNYQLLEHTGFVFSFGKQVGVSIFSNQSTETENLSIALRQRLLGRFYVNFGYGMTNVDFEDIFSEVLSRGDEREFFDIRLSTTVLQKLSMSVFYRKTENDSSLSRFGQSGDQTGIELSYRY